MTTLRQLENNNTHLERFMIHKAFGSFVSSVAALPYQSISEQLDPSNLETITPTLNADLVSMGYAGSIEVSETMFGTVSQLQNILYGNLSRTNCLNFLVTCDEAFWDTAKAKGILTSDNSTVEAYCLEVESYLEDDVDYYDDDEYYGE